MNVNIYDRQLICKIEYSRRKTIQIKLLPPDNVSIKAPYGFSNMEIKAFVEGKRNWIKKKLDFFEQHNIQVMDRKYVEGEKLLLYGDEYILSITENNHKKSSVALESHKLIVNSPSAKSELIKQVLEAFYRIKAKEIIFSLSLKYEGLLGLKPNMIRIKKQKKRWGSCSSKGNLNFNFKLAMAPIRVIDYVVLHEFCHLRHMNHSREFWNLVEEYMPDYLEKREWLRINGHRLEL
ncbi:MAG: M48 family metallopeptidase [Maledivibacter sp.]|jgi:predicted metal-dependent hydrolase|nr:M48 family metallopeptidase [Maledivibacter sp.]